MSKEGHFLTKLNSKQLLHSIKFYGESYHEGVGYIKLEFVDYSLAEYIAKYKKVEGRLAVPMIGSQCLRALQELHEVGYLHQDVKPDNFRVSEDNVVKMLDFGLVNEFLTNGVHK